MADWHLFGFLGMMPFNIPTDPAMPQFLERAKQEIPALIVHGPYRDYQIGQGANDANSLPPGDRIFGTGTSLGCNNLTEWASWVKHDLDGIFGFQASNMGIHFPVPANVKFAYEFNSDIPIPAPGIGAYRWERGTGMRGGIVLQTHNIVHPGDYDVEDQMKFIDCMKRIIANG